MIWIYPSKELKSIYTRHSHFETSLTKKIIRCLSTTPKATFFIYIYLHIAIHSIDSPKTGRRNAQNANSYYTYRPNWVHGDPMTLWTQSTQNNLFERTSISLVFSKLTELKRISFTFLGNWNIWILTKVQTSMTHQEFSPQTCFQRKV